MPNVRFGVSPESAPGGRARTRASAPRWGNEAAMSSVRVAVVQAGSILFDSEATLAKAERLTAEAAGTGAS